MQITLYDVIVVNRQSIDFKENKGKVDDIVFEFNYVLSLTSIKYLYQISSSPKEWVYFLLALCPLHGQLASWAPAVA